MNSTKKYHPPEYMSQVEFEEALKFFYPELFDILHSKIINDKFVNIHQYNDYKINGFDKNYYHHIKETGVMVGNNNITAYLMESCDYYNSSYHKPYKTLVFLDLFKYLSENKEKHVFWFL